MAGKTAIGWTDSTWNPTHGCSRVSEGCRFCYAETLSLRLGVTGKPWTHVNAAENVLLKPHKLREPYKWRRPSRVFVNSMSDLFHPKIPHEYLRQIWDVMMDLPQHRFQILTKRPHEAAKWPGPWPDHIWMGTTVENRKAIPRINKLRDTGAAVKFLSCEPLLGDMGQPNLKGIDWVIAGGESGSHITKPENRHRWMDHAWARNLRDACLRDDVAYFFKQSSGYRTELNVALEHEDGSFWLWMQYPDLRRAPMQIERQIHGHQVGEYLHESLSDQIEHGETPPPATLFD